MTVRVTEEVPRSTLRAVNERASSNAEFAERLVARYYGLRHEPDAEDWYDAVDRDTGSKYEVKSARKRVGEEYPADGRFRLWRSQLRSLTASRSSGSGTTWVVFVVFDDGRPVVMRRMHARTCRSIVEETVGWGPSGHDDWTQQAKVPLDAVFSSTSLG